MVGGLKLLGGMPCYPIGLFNDYLSILLFYFNYMKDIGLPAALFGNFPCSLE